MKKLIVFLMILSNIYSMKLNKEKVLKDMKPLALKKINYSKEIHKYFDFYKLNYPEVLHYFGYFDSNDLRLAGHIFLPANRDIKGTVFIQHGYLDNVGYLQKIIDYFLAFDYAVAAFDLPGHGLSSGERSGIDSFNVYGNVFKEFADTYSPLLPSPYYSIGHSTGCSAILEYLYKGDSIFTKNYFIAPLVRTVRWKTSKVGYAITSPFTDRLDRIYRKSSHDESFLKFQKTEPLRIDSLGLSWSKSLYKWNNDLINRKVLEEDVMVIQGTEDGVVEYRYNIPFLKEKIDDLQVHYIEGAEHALPNEISDYRNKTFKLIRKDMEK